MKKLVILSGGLDSTTVLYYVLKNLCNGDTSKVIALSFDFGQKYKPHNDPNKCMFQNNPVELEYAKRTTKKLGVKHIVVDASWMNKILEEMQTNTKKYNYDKNGEQPKTCMPFRNLNLLSAAYAIAELEGCDEIYDGFQKQDEHGYWDTTKTFTKAIEMIASLNPNNKAILTSPFIAWNKSDEIKLGIELGIDYSDTWSCYNPLSENENIYACGECPSCKDRIANFKKLNKKDPLIYWDERF